MKNRLFYGFLGAVLLTAMGLLGYFYYLLLWPVTVTKFNVARFQVLTKNVKQGGTLLYVVDYCKYKDFSANLSRSFVDSLVYRTPNTTGNLAIGCHQVTTSLQVPLALSPGVYHLEITVSYDVNPLRTETHKLATEEFQVLPRR